MKSADDTPLGRNGTVSTKLPRPVFVLKIEYAGTPEFAVHGLRKLLKRLLRDCHFRVRSLEEIGGPQ